MFPIAVVLTGIALFALPIVVFPLAAPAVWSGASTLGSMGQLTAIASKRLLLVLMLMIAVLLITVVVGLLIGSVMLAGASFVTLLSLAILGGGQVSGWSPVGMGIDAMGRGLSAVTLDAHASGALWGGSLLCLAALALPAIVYLRGACTVYLRAIEGLDLHAEEQAFDLRLAAARSKARDVQAQARATAQRYAQRGPAAPSMDEAVPSEAAPRLGSARPMGEATQSVVSGAMPPSPQADEFTRPCSACGSQTAADDDYCSQCGLRLSV